jgi:Protein of unknown function (DUF1344)
MFRTAAALAAVLAVGSVDAALADEAESGISGTIQSIDQGTGTVVLDNGKSYRLNADQHVSTLREGSRINLSCDDDMTNCMVSESGTTGEGGPTGQSDTPESATQPSAGAETGGGAASGNTGSETVPPGNAPDNTSTPSDAGGSSSSGSSGGDSSGSGN